MRVLIDTNILISSILWSGTPYQAYIKAVSYPNKGIICTQNVDELRRIFNRKFPAKIDMMEHLTNVINDIDTEKSKLKPHKLLYDD